MSIAPEHIVRQAAAERAMRDPSPLTIFMGLFAVALGAAVVLGRREAWIGPEYTAALYVPGAPESWGWLLLLLGVVVIVGKYAFNRSSIVLLIGLGGCGVWHVSMMTSFIVSASTVPDVGLTQCVIHLFLAVLYFYRLAVYRRPPIHLS
ncbi:putative integral membrane protein [Rhodococcus phage E3]|uniref:putative integral membrane protein n=1 Tax=Rhodococcus phage E3 TaxID=1007869 RepID=UPI0002C6ABF9|nr:putative integral membrane protein [Rhodococcus phage E3]AEQ20913.1 putative integral membrane protein [Rhodococcus phage E3]